MRELFLAFLLVLPMTVFAKTTISESFYKKDIEKCDKQFEKDISKNSTGSGMISAADSQVVCYESVTHKIIDMYYSKQSKVMKNNLREAITAYKKSVDDMYNPDRCYNECGNLTALMAYTPVLDFVKDYIESLTEAINSNF